jgi:hypothetical protein
MLNIVPGSLLAEGLRRRRVAFLLTGRRRGYEVTDIPLCSPLPK